MVIDELFSSILLHFVKIKNSCFTAICYSRVPNKRPPAYIFSKNFIWFYLMFQRSFIRLLGLPVYSGPKSKCISITEVFPCLESGFRKDVFQQSSGKYFNVFGHSTLFIVDLRLVTKLNTSHAFFLFVILPGLNRVFSIASSLHTVCKTKFT